MKMRYYGYNAFIIDPDGAAVFVDPGKNLHWRRMNSLIPLESWNTARLILLSHGDPDHSTYATSISCVSKAPIVCSTALAGKLRRSKTRVHSISPGHRIRIGNTEILGIEVQHGPIIAFRRTNISFKPKMVGVGSIGFYFNIGNHTFLNLGDTLFLRDRWKDIKPDVLMVPVGGLMTMDLGEAISAIQEIRPKTIVPVHYDWHLLVYHRKTNLKSLETAMHDMRIAYCNILPGAQAEI